MSTNRTLNARSVPTPQSLVWRIRLRQLLALDHLLELFHALQLHLVDLLLRQSVPRVNGGDHLSLGLSVHEPLVVQDHVLHHILEAEVTKTSGNSLPLLRLDVQQPVVSRYLGDVYNERNAEAAPLSFHQPGFRGDPGMCEDWKLHTF